jgi:hypothetical protein
MRGFLTFQQVFVGFAWGVIASIIGNAVGGGSYPAMAIGALLGFGAGAGFVHMLGGGPGGASEGVRGPGAARDSGGGGSE